MATVGLTSLTLELELELDWGVETTSGVMCRVTWDSVLLHLPPLYAREVVVGGRQRVDSSSG